MELVRSRGVQGDGTDRTKTQAQIFTRFGLTWHQKAHFSEILEFQCTRNGSQNLPFCPGSLQDTFIIYSSISHQHIFSEMFPRKIKNGIWVSGNPGLVSGSPPGGSYFQKWPPKNPVISSWAKAGTRHSDSHPCIGLEIGWMNKWLCLSYINWINQE